MELRRIEEEVTLAMRCRRHVVATGGSVVYSRKAMNHLRMAGTAVFLDVDVATLASRIDDFETRGLAKGKEQTLVDLYVDAINEAVGHRPAEMVVGVHMCRGNFKGRYLAEGGYDSVAEKLFQRAEVNHFLLEYDTPRAGDFSPLRFLGPRKAAVLGLVSTKTPKLETIGALCRRIEEAAAVVPMDRLAISPQCGFASTVAGNPVTEADERAKLRLVVEAARAIWG